MGSFVGATVWRLRAVQLREDKEEGSKHAAAKKQVSKLKKASLLHDRSVCLHCGHQLRWYDLVPLLSWLSLRGKCRYCKKPIGRFEPLIEILLAAFFVVSYVFWPLPLETTLEVARLVIWLVAGVAIAILAVYDFKWFLLPNRVMFPLIGVGVVYSLVVLALNQFSIDALMNIVYGCLILSGTYYLIYVLSSHQWVGFGDVKLGLALALLLADWQLSIMALFLANAIGTVLVLPLLLSGKLKRQAHIPFGPLLISGWLLSGLFGTQIVQWYLHISLGA